MATETEVALLVTTNIDPQTLQYVGGWFFEYIVMPLLQLIFDTESIQKFDQSMMAYCVPKNLDSLPMMRCTIEQIEYDLLFGDGSLMGLVFIIMVVSVLTYAFVKNAYENWKYRDATGLPENKSRGSFPSSTYGSSNSKPVSHKQMVGDWHDGTLKVAPRTTTAVPKGWT